MGPTNVPIHLYTSRDKTLRVFYLSFLTRLKQLFNHSLFVRNTRFSVESVIAHAFGHKLAGCQPGDESKIGVKMEAGCMREKKKHISVTAEFTHFDRRDAG